MTSLRLAPYGPTVPTKTLWVLTENYMRERQTNKKIWIYKIQYLKNYQCYQIHITELYPFCGPTYLRRWVSGWSEINAGPDWIITIPSEHPDQVWQTKDMWKHVVLTFYETEDCLTAVGSEILATILGIIYSEMGLDITVAGKFAKQNGIKNNNNDGNKNLHKLKHNKKDKTPQRTKLRPLGKSL